MKQSIFFLAIALTACNADVKVDTPVTEARAVFAALHNARAPNVGVTDCGVSVYYLDSDASFSLYFNQCATLDFDGKVQQFDCAVYQIEPGVWIAEMANGDIVRLNTKTGNTGIVIDGNVRMYYKDKTP